MICKELIDLTHPLHEGVPTWSGRCGFRLEIRLDYDQGLRVHSFKSHAGIGTHMDAPSHFIPGGLNIDQIPLEHLLAPACVLDLREFAGPDFLVELRYVESYEKKYGPIPAGAVVIAFTGWDRYWNQPEKYRNPDKTGKMHFPGFSAACAEALSQRPIAGIGIDTLSPDGANKGFPVHLAMLGAGKYILENLAALERMPAKGAFILSLPIPLVGASESVIRAIALAFSDNPKIC